MHNELFIAAFSAFFLGPYAFLGIGVLAENNDPIAMYYLAALFGDVGGCMFSYSLGYFFKDKIASIFEFFKIKKETLDRAHRAVEKKALFPLFLVIPLMSHSVDAAIYLVCGLLRISALRFFLAVLFANIILSIGMITFGGTIQAVIFPLFQEHFSFKNYFLLLILGISIYLLIKNKNKLTI